VSCALHPLTEEQTEVQKLAREFAHAEITPHAAEWDQKAYFEPSLVKKLGDLGFLGMMVP
jgi:alkylation response protein AidB-like acyl-CoA dehydrogenase